jgi:hypothetical protein
VFTDGDSDEIIRALGHVARARGMANDAALLTYRTDERLADGSDIRHARRCSLWLRVEGRWQVRYHQATPTTENPG